MTSTTRPAHRVAITGIGLICAVGDNTEAVWKAVAGGDTGIRPTQRLDVSTLSCQYSAEVEAEARPRRRPKGRIDRATGFALEAVQQALDSAALDLTGLDPYRVGVALGTSVGGLDEGEQFHWQLMRGGVEATRAHHLFVYPLYTAADAISAAYGAKGPKVVISNACAAGANSIGYAIDTIRYGRADVMLAGGVDVLDILSLAGFDSLKALDPQPCAPYSRSTGLNLGEGAAMLVLESEQAVARRGVEPVAWLRGYALTSDAHHATAPDPAGSGARRAMLHALQRSGLTPDDVDYVNGHGTGTPANDSAERKAINAVMPPRVPMSSTKSQVGHMLGAAGAIETAVSALALRDGILPPTCNVAEVSESGRDVVANHGRPAQLDVVVSNSFAFGGNNCSVVLSRSPGDPVEAPHRRVVLTGAGVVSPVGVGRFAFLEAIKSGQVAIGPARVVDTSLARRHLVAEVTDTGFRRYVDPAYARRLDQLGLLVLAASRMALQDAGVQVTRANTERVGMVFGTYTGPLETVAALTETIGREGPHKVNPRLFPNSVMNAAVGHACLSLQIKGPLSTLASGCASGLTGLGYAADLVSRGEADTMLAISADELTPLLHLGYDRLGLLAESGVHPYDRQASGCALGAGSAALVVESLDHALARGATILAELTGHAVTSDAYRVAGNDPSGEAWAASLRAAMDAAGRPVTDVAAYYGDARGTAAIDLAEARAVAATWPAGGVRVANLSGQVGHVHSTTPLMSVIAAAETCRTGWVPPVAGLADPLPEVAPYLAGPAVPPAGRACVVTAANWGGTYASVVLEPLSDRAE